MTANSDRLNRKRLFLAANVAMFMIGLGFAVRANIAASLQQQLFDRLDLANSTHMVGQALGITFTGFALTLLFGSALVDLVGARRVLLFSVFGFVGGSILVWMASLLPIGAATFPLVLIGLLLTGLGWGAVEAGTNPMVAAIYPDDKTNRLNILHAWWPAGIVIGGLSGLAFAALHWAWQVNLLLLIVPAAWLAWLAFTTEFPVTERVASGASYGDMFRELGRQPIFILWFLGMMLTVACELAPGQWVELALSRVVGMHGILLLVYVSALMFVMRHFAGALSRWMSSIGILCLGSVLAAIGLYGLSLATTPLSAFAAATIWSIGVCYFYPTMVASVAERFPRGGALFMGLIGFAGGISIQFVLPRLGAIFDRAKLNMAGGEYNFAHLAPQQREAVLRYASVQSFRSIVLIPLALLPLFGIIFLRDYLKRSRTSAGRPQSSPEIATELPS
jgi:MFS family permease